MALTERTVEDKIEIVGDFKHIQVRKSRVIYDNGTEISRGHSRHVVAPDADVSGESVEMQAIAAAVHTQAVKDAYAAHLASQQPEQEPASEENTD